MFIIGIVLLLISAIFLFGGIYVLTKPDPDRYTMSFCFFFMAVVFFLVPAIFFFKKGVDYRRRQADMEKVVEYLRVVRRAPVRSIAESIDKSEMETVLLLKEAMDRGLVSGQFSGEGDETEFQITDFHPPPYKY